MLSQEIHHLSEHVSDLSRVMSAWPTRDMQSSQFSRTKQKLRLAKQSTSTHHQQTLTPHYQSPCSTWTSSKNQWRRLKRRSSLTRMPPKPISRSASHTVPRAGSSRA